jgi:hypothetical protein
MSGGEIEAREYVQECLRVSLQNLNEACNQLRLVDKEGAQARAVGGLATVLAAIMDAWMDVEPSITADERQEDE